MYIYIPNRTCFSRSDHPGFPGKHHEINRVAQLLHCGSGVSNTLPMWDKVGTIQLCNWCSFHRVHSTWLHVCVWVYLASWGEYLQWHGFSNLVFALMAIFIYVVVTLWSLRVLSELAIFTPRLLTLHCWGDLSVMPTALLGIGNVQQFARYSCCGAMRTDIQNL